AMERASAFRGRYHVLGGLLSALDGVGPDKLRAGELVARAGDGTVREVILALPATVDGQTTAHYLAERLATTGVAVTMLA
ncbi:MAG TPA: toprim domain-containing protein, partial [Caulobacter sp.]|nr:toprim domain-containing protein [Caulobacter sp.]